MAKLQAEWMKLANKERRRFCVQAALDKTWAET
jgi:hypothetical protein